ncbi:MAG: DUF3093 domain-containing protein [Actinobacteria bacterium]|nr:DUF3093 domain-containing protein [Actinomycetota bacterium]MBU1609774.1 DUF3093 domain-containing protein [Actinomycetota bacterium]MBU2316279.1 DUF3093 domain-containing protein [Actinomycetota bacterium]MBU2385755.1 DUF3093 domain-containing protein [Actinomycetota bacterium]
MPVFRERLHPSPWLHLVALLALPASMLVLAPVSLPAGVVTGVVLSGGLILLLWALAPVIEIAEGVLTAGRARISLRLLGSVEIARGEEARQARGPGLDARAWLLLRGDVDPVVRIEIADADDPTPYWLISSRRPDDLAIAISSAPAAEGHS